MTIYLSIGLDGVARRVTQLPEGPLRFLELPNPYRNASSQSQDMDTRSNGITQPMFVLPVQFKKVKSDSTAEYLPGGVAGIYIEIKLPYTNHAKCDQQFRSIDNQKKFPMRYRSKLSKEEASMTVAKLVASIIEDLLYLRNQCATHGNTIISRWKKKSREKRGDTLLNAEPDIYQEQWLVRHYAKYGVYSGME